MRLLAHTTWLAAWLGFLSPAGQAQDLSGCTSFPFEAPHVGAPDTTYVVHHARVSVDVDENGTFAGRADLDIRTAIEADSLLLLSPGDVDSVLAAGEPVEVGTRSADSLYLVLPDSMAAGTLARLTVFFRGQGERPTDDLVHTVDPLVTWFPSSPNPHGRFTTDLEITVPDTWAVAATGIPTSQVSSGDGRVTYAYASPHELPARRIAFAGGRVDMGTEFASLPAGRRPAVAWWMPQSRPSDRPRAAGATLPVIAEMLGLYSEWTGFPFPFDRYTQLHVDGYPEASVGLGRVPPRIEPDDRGTTPYDGHSDLAAPLVRQWFGGLVSASSWSHAWLEEAFSEYLSAMLPESASVPGEAMARLRTQYMRADSGRSRPLVWDRWNHPSELLGASASARGAWVLHMLRRIVGEDAFQEAVRQFLNVHQFQGVSTGDWLQALETSSDLDQSDSDLSEFFEAWIYRGGHPVLAADYTSENGTLRLRIEQTQSGDTVPSVYSLDLTVEVGSLGGSERFDVTVDEQVELFDLPFSATPRYVALDPEGDWLLETRLDQPSSAWVAQLRQATTAHARFSAAEALRDLPQDPALLLGLRSALDGEEHPDVRASIIEAIASLRLDGAVERALTAAFETEIPQLRRAVLQALGDTSSSAAASQLALRAAQNDPAYAVQAEAVLTLARMGAPNALDVARSALITPSHDDVIRAAGLDAMAVLHGEAPDEALEQGLRYAEPGHPERLRTAAVRLLGHLAPDRPEAEELLVARLGDESRAVAEAAVDALLSAGLENQVVEHADAITVQSVRARVSSTISCR